MNPILKFLIGADTTRLKRDLTGGEKAIAKLKGAMLKLGGVLAGVFAVRAIGGFIKSTMQLADVQLKAEAALLTALNNNKTATKELIALAGARQKVTLFGDEETIRMQASLAMFVKNKDAIVKLTPAIQDLATGLGMDLNGAAMLVAKTLGSSTNAMKRYGIDVEGAVGSGARLDSVLLGINSKFKDQAKIAAETGLGPLQKLKNMWGDMKEQIGMRLIPVLNIFANWFAEKLPKIQEVVLRVFGDTAKVLAKWEYRFAELSRQAMFYKNIWNHGWKMANVLDVSQKALNEFRLENARKEVEDFKKETIASEAGAAFAAFALRQLATSAGGVGGVGDLMANATRKIADFNKQLKTAKGEEVALLKRSIAYWEAYRAALTGEKKPNITPGGGGAGGARIAPKATGGISGIASISAGMPQFSTDMQAVSTTLDEMQPKIISFADSWNVVDHNMRAAADSMRNMELATSALNAVTQMFNEVSNIASMDAEDRAEAYKKAAHGIISALIAEGITSVVTATLKKASFTGPLAIPIAAAAGAAAAMMFNIAIPKFAKGGIVPSGFSGDSYPAMLSSGETVLPKPKGLGTGGGSMNVHGVIFGDDLLLVNQRASRRYNSIRGYANGG